eukprot:4042009-Prymnesium_polylepis.1
MKRRTGTDESEVGIFEYVSPDAGGIGGVLKTLASDFCVNELDMRGREVRHRPDASATAATLATVELRADNGATRDGACDGASSSSVPTEVVPTEAADGLACASWEVEEADGAAAFDEAAEDWQGDGSSDPQGVVRFVLAKERMDTLGAIGELAALLNVPSRNFSFAGLKDFRAITAQRVS